MRAITWSMLGLLAVLAMPARAEDNEEKLCQRAFRFVNSKCPELLSGLSCRDNRDQVQAAYDQCKGEGGGRKAKAKPAPAPAAPAASPAAPAKAAPTASPAAPAKAAPAAAPAAPAAPATAPADGITSGNLKPGEGVGRHQCLASADGVDINVTSNRTVGVATCKGEIEAEYQKRLCAGKAGQKIAFSWQFADTKGTGTFKCK